MLLLHSFVVHCADCHPLSALADLFSIRVIRQTRSSLHVGTYTYLLVVDMLPRHDVGHAGTSVTIYIVLYNYSVHAVVSIVPPTGEDWPLFLTTV